MSSPATARRLWALGEPYHALTYFTAESRAAGEAVGLTGFWNGYFAFRAAPLGVVGPAVVTATFYNFAPAFVARRVPAVWETATPTAALVARLAGVDAAVRRVLGEDWLTSTEAAETAELVRIAAEAVELPGRPLAAANTGSPSRTSRTCCCGRASPRCASTAATGTTPRCSSARSTGRPRTCLPLRPGDPTATG